LLVLGWVLAISGACGSEPRVWPPDTTVAEALNQMLFGGFRHLPVMDEDPVVRIVSMRDLAKSIAKE
jgi:predicted transcriptional regulator